MKMDQLTDVVSDYVDESEIDGDEIGDNSATFDLNAVGILKLHHTSSRTCTLHVVIEVVTYAVRQ